MNPGAEQILVFLVCLFAVTAFAGWFQYREASKEKRDRLTTASKIALLSAMAAGGAWLWAWVDVELYAGDWERHERLVAFPIAVFLPAIAGYVSHKMKAGKIGAARMLSDYANKPPDTEEE